MSENSFSFSSLDASEISSACEQKNQHNKNNGQKTMCATIDFNTECHNYLKVVPFNKFPFLEKC
jgi:hypothetical protein